MKLIGVIGVKGAFEFEKKIKTPDNSFLVRRLIWSPKMDEEVEIPNFGKIFHIMSKVKDNHSVECSKSKAYRTRKEVHEKIEVTRNEPTK